LNEGALGDLVPEEIERILLRLASPLEYSNELAYVNNSIGTLNRWLEAEELKLVLEGVRPRLQEITSSTPLPAPRQKVSFQKEPAPDFRKFVTDAPLSKILFFLWEEAQRCVEGGAYLAAVLMMGSILEGVLLHTIESNIATANAAKASPKDKAGSPRPLNEWGLNNFIEVAHEVHWLGGDITRFSHALRESRNFIHPHKQRQERSTPDYDTAAICWQVVRAAVRDLLKLQASTATGTP
jgi:hypothetical protein